MKIELIHTNVAKNTVVFQSKCDTNGWILNDIKFEYDIDESLENVPVSILNVSFVLSIIPMCLYKEVELHVDDIDLVFYENLGKILESFSATDSNWKPRMKVVAKNTTLNTNTENPTYDAITLFSCGKDAWFTALKCRNEKQLLLHVIGLDYYVWNYEKSHIPCLLEKTSKQLSMLIVKCKTNIRQVLKGVDWLYSDHAMRTIAHAVPLAWLYNAKQIYVSSGRRKNIPYQLDGSQWHIRPTACESSIMNTIEFGNTRVSMIGQEYTATQKIKYINDLANWILGIDDIEFHVCWETQTGKNCCKCDKCCSVIYNIACLSLDPKKFGFDEVHPELIAKHKKPLWDL